jgi:hypothetical protein
MELRTFGQVHFGRSDFGDKRLTKRLIKIGDQMMEHPSGTAPAKMQSPADLEGLYRFVNNDKVSHRTILASHQQYTKEQIAAAGLAGRTVHILYDTTELDYSTLKSNKDLGPIGGGYNRGFLCHNGLAIYGDTREVIGLVSQVVVKRPKPPKQERRPDSRKREDRESRLWVRGVEQAGELPKTGKVINIADRGADTFEYLDYMVRTLQLVLVRSKNNRVCFRGHEGTGEQIKLHDAVRQEPPRGTRTITLEARGERPKRDVVLNITWLAIQLRAPRYPRGKHGKDPLKLWVVRASEQNPPPGHEGIEWLVLTNDPITSVEDAIATIEAYENRGVVEEFHKAMKTGVSIEEMQFTTGLALLAMIAILSVIAVPLIQMRDLAKDERQQDRRAREFLPASWVTLLSLWRYKEERDLTVRDFVWALGRLGGHQNRKHDGPPGWQTLWKGMTQLRAMLRGASCLGNKCWQKM